VLFLSMPSILSVRLPRDLPEATATYRKVCIQAASSHLCSLSCSCCVAVFSLVRLSSFTHHRSAFLVAKRQRPRKKRPMSTYSTLSTSGAPYLGAHLQWPSFTQPYVTGISPYMYLGVGHQKFIGMSCSRCGIG
jgi:hypothetical protein